MYVQNIFSQLKCHVQPWDGLHHFFKMFCQMYFQMYFQNAFYKCISATQGPRAAIGLVAPLFKVTSVENGRQ